MNRCILLPLQLLLILILILVPLSANAQTCSGIFDLDTQEEIDSWDCQIAHGLINIRGNAITNLNGLSELQQASGLTIRNTGLTTLQGLNNLREGLTFLMIENNANLVSLQGLNALRTVESDARISNNGALINLGGLDVFRSVVNLYIEDNDALQSLQGLTSLTSVHLLEIKNNGALSSLEVGPSFLSGPTATAITIQNNPSLTTLEGLEGRSTWSWIRVINNDGLVSLTGLESATHIFFDMSVNDNAALTSCRRGMNGLISGNPQAFTGVSGPVTITNNLTGGRCTSPAVVLATPFNLPPVADAGADREVVAGEAFALDGSGSTDPDGDVLSYSWTLNGLEVGTGVAPQVVLPEGVHLLVLTTTDGYGGSDTDEVRITAVAPNQPPVADAGEEQTVVAGETVALDGSDSSDPDGDPITFAWTLDGPGYSDVSLAGVGPTFCAAEAGTYTATLVVDDGTDTSFPDAVVVTALPVSEALDALVDDVDALQQEAALNQGQSRALSRKLIQGQQLLERGKIAEALAVLAGFRKQVLDLWMLDGVLTEGQAAELVVSVDAVSGAVGSSCTRVEAAALEVSVGDGPAAEAMKSTSHGAASIAMPEAYALEAGYPNPMQSSATIDFAVPEAARVRIAVYDVLGREVSLLVQGAVDAGRHTVVFNAARLPSGWYLVRMNAEGGFAQTQRLMIVR